MGVWGRSPSRRGKIFTCFYKNSSILRPFYVKFWSKRQVFSSANIHKISMKQLKGTSYLFGHLSLSSRTSLRPEKSKSFVALFATCQTANAKLLWVLAGKHLKYNLAPTSCLRCYCMMNCP